MTTTLVLFDLGGTLEDRGRLRPGALEVLTALAARPDAVRPALLSDFRMPSEQFILYSMSPCSNHTNQVRFRTELNLRLRRSR